MINMMNFSLSNDDEEIISGICAKDQLLHGIYRKDGHFLFTKIWTKKEKSGEFYLRKFSCEVFSYDIRNSFSH